MITKEALDDDRYIQHTSVSKTINSHPKDWLLTFGMNAPAIIHQFVKHTGRTVKHTLFPDYSQCDGWRWISKEMREFKRSGENYESL